jgi:glyoxylase I family protein
MNLNTSMTPGILGLSHITLSVRDRDAARHFWADVLGFTIVDESPEVCFLLERSARLAVLLTDHDRTVTGGFDEHHVGLDHLALAVSQVEILRSWQQRLAAAGVPHSPIVETDGGHHLNLRAPDQIQIELYVMSDEFAGSLGLDADEQPVAVS